MSQAETRGGGGTLSFRPFAGEADLLAQRSLFRLCFPEVAEETPATEEHYRWKFQSVRHTPPSYEYVAQLDQKLGGYYAAIPFRYTIGGHSALAGMVCDVMTHPEARGKGIFTKLGAYALGQMQEAGVNFTTGYPIRPEVIPGHLKVGWKVVENMPVYVKVLSARKVLQQKGVGFLAPLANPIILLSHAFVCASKAYSVEKMTPNEAVESPWYPAFLRQWRAHVANALDKDSDFLKWRLGAPRTDYHFFVARNNHGEPVGICITRATDLQGVPTLAIVDLMLLPGQFKAFSSLDAALVKEVRSRGCELIATMLAERWARQYCFLGSLYIKSPHVFSLIVKHLGTQPAPETLFQPASWHTMWIDSDDL